jgi:general stress protein YciG
MSESKVHLRGFASQTPERRREIASMGGKKAHALGKAHRWTPEEARAAGRLGGLVSGPKPTLRKENRVDAPVSEAVSEVEEASAETN